MFTNVSKKILFARSGFAIRYGIGYGLQIRNQRENVSKNRSSKLLFWSIIAVVLNLLMLTPVLPVDYGGFAFAQTGPPADTPTIIPTATGTATPTPSTTATPVPTSTPIPATSVPVTINTPRVTVAVEEITKKNQESSGSSSEKSATSTFTPLPRTGGTATAAPKPDDKKPTEGTDDKKPTEGTPPKPDDKNSTAGTPKPGDKKPTAESLVPPIKNTVASEKITEDKLPTDMPKPIEGESNYKIPPSSDGAVSKIETQLKNGTDLNLIVPASSEGNKYVKVNEDTKLATNPPAPIPSSVKTSSMFNVDVYLTENDKTTIQHIHSPELVFTTNLTNKLEVPEGKKAVLLRYNEAESRYEYPEQKYIRETNTLEAHLPETSFFILATVIEQTDTNAPVIPVPLEATSSIVTPTPTSTSTPIPATIPTALPIAPGGSTDGGNTGTPLSLWFLLLIMLIGLIASVAMFFLFGKDKSRGTRSAMIPDHDYDSDSLVFAFASSSSNGKGVIQVNLSSLADIFSAEATLPNQSSGTQLNLPSIEVDVTINPVRADVLKNRQAIMLSNGNKLRGWNGTKLDAAELAETVYIGHLNWPHQRNIFTYLNRLRKGDEVQTQDQAENCNQYQIDNVQTYHSDTTPVVEISQAVSDTQLVLVAWSEAYELDAQEYRDYVVIQAEEVRN